MSRIWLRLMSIVVYIGALLLLLGISVQKLFSLKLMVLVILGTGVLFLPYYSKELKWEHMGEILGRKALEAGYIQTFILLFMYLSQQASIEDLFENIALNCRPLLYGYCIYILLETESTYKKQDQKKTESISNHKVFKVEQFGKQNDELLSSTIKVDGANKEVYTINRMIQEGNKESIGCKNNEINKAKQQIHQYFKEMGLTKREIEIAQAILKGMSNREIAESFYVSEATVKKHVSHIFEKLGIQKRDEIKKVVCESTELKALCE